MHRICMISDFFYPNSGGVESHIFSLSQCLLRLGHKVVVVTRSYGDRVGVRYMTGGLKVYYCPMCTFYRGSVMPTVFASLPLLRYIFVREKIEIVHAHSAFSTLAHEGLFHATNLGLKTVFTDHSLFGFADASAVLTNSLLSISLSSCSRCICVSYTGKENTVLRACVNSRRVSVIPNAVDGAVFRPADVDLPQDTITVVMVSRLVYRKGVDLLVALLPLACRRMPRLRFIIAGDGDKRTLLEETVDRHALAARVTLLGALRHHQVRHVLLQGHIYINCSLTEAFCMSILEAASCGLLVVSTRVGGVPEVLPPHMLELTEPTAGGLCRGLQAAVSRLDAGGGAVAQRWERHRQLANSYSWDNVAQRTLIVYKQASEDRPVTAADITRGVLSSMSALSLLVVLVLQMCRLALRLLDWLQPAEDIDVAPDYNTCTLNTQDHCSNPQDTSGCKTSIQDAGTFRTATPTSRARAKQPD